MSTLLLTEFDKPIVDMEWKQLMIEARNMGLSIEEVKGILQLLMTKNKPS